MKITPYVLNKTFIAQILLSSHLMLFRPFYVFGEDIVVDSVVAAVNNEAITLEELNKISGSKLSLSELNSNQQAKEALGVLINRQLIEQEASKNQLDVSEAEIQAQLEALAERNRLSFEDFSVALANQGQSLSDLRDEIKFQILRSKVVSKEVRNNSVVPKSKIDEYVAEAKKAQKKALEDSKNGQQITFNYLVFQSEEQAHKAYSEVKKGVPFEDAAKAFGSADTIFSQQTVSKSDLDTKLQSALDSLSFGEVSDVIESRQGFMLVQSLKPPLVTKKTTAELKSEAQRALEGELIQEKANRYLRDELPKNHSIEFVSNLDEANDKLN